MPGVVLGEKNLFTDAESLFSCEVPPAHSVLFPRVAVGSFCVSWGTTGRLRRVPASPGCGSRPVPAGHGPRARPPSMRPWWGSARPVPAEHGPGTWPRGQLPCMRLCWSSALPWLPALLAPRPAAMPALGSAAQRDPAAVQPRCSCVSTKADPLGWVPPPPHLDDARIKVGARFFFSLCLVVQSATGDRQRLPNCILHLFVSKCSFVR